MENYMRVLYLVFKKKEEIRMFFLRLVLSKSL